jgi:predicted nucleic acid-binding protein
MSLVLDSSIVGCWCFPDEASAVADHAWRRVSVGGAVVPALWWFEVRNILLINERRGRVAPTDTEEFLADLEKLPIRIDQDPKGGTALALARAYRLTFYDAAYLDLARRLNAPLATLDRQLATAARAARAPLLGEGDVQ